MSTFLDFCKILKIDGSKIKLSTKDINVKKDVIGKYVSADFYLKTKYDPYWTNGEYLWNNNIIFHYELNSADESDNTIAWKIRSCFEYESKQGYKYKNIWFVYMDPIDAGENIKESNYMKNITEIKQFNKSEYYKKLSSSKKSKSTVAKKLTVAKKSTVAEKSTVAKKSTPNNMIVTKRSVTHQTVAWTGQNPSSISIPPDCSNISYSEIITEEQLVNAKKLENNNKFEELEETKEEENNDEEVEETKEEKNNNEGDEEVEETKEENDHQEKSTINKDTNIDNLFLTFTFNVENQEKINSDFLVAIPFSKQHTYSPKRDQFIQIWMANYYTWWLQFGKDIKAPVYPDTFTNIHNDIDKWNEWDITYEKWFYDFIKKNIMVHF